MGLRMRKSIRLGKGVNVNFGKKGASLSFGTKGFRQTIHTSGRRTSSIGIPGTGISYVTSTGGSSKRNYNSQNRQQKEMNKFNELEQNRLAVEQYNELVESLKGIHKYCDDYIDWNHLYSLNEPFNPEGIGPKEVNAIEKYENYKPSFVEKIFKSLMNNKKLKLKDAIKTAAQEDKNDYEEWSNLHILSEKVLQGDIDSYLQIIEEVNPLDDLIEYGSDFEIVAEDPSTIEVEFNVKSNVIIPDYSLSLTQTGKLSRKNLSKTAYYDLTQDYVCSCSIRIAMDIFALLPIDNVYVHAIDNMLNASTGYNEDVNILSVHFKREVLENLNMQLIDPSEALNNFRCNMRFMKTSGFKPVDRVTKIN